MNAYSPMAQSRIRPHDIDFALRSHRFMAVPDLAMLERHRGWQAEAELDWLLRQNRGAAGTASSIVAALRQAIGAMLVHAGRRLAGDASNSGVPQTAPDGRLQDVSLGLRLGDAIPSR